MPRGAFRARSADPAARRVARCRRAGPHSSRWQEAAHLVPAGARQRQIPPRRHWTLPGHIARHGARESPVKPSIDSSVGSRRLRPCRIPLRLDARRSSRSLRGHALARRRTDQEPAAGHAHAPRRALAYLDLPAALFTKADLRAARDALTERGLTRQPAKLVAALGTALQWAAQKTSLSTTLPLP